MVFRPKTGICYNQVSPYNIKKINLNTDRQINKLINKPGLVVQTFNLSLSEFNASLVYRLRPV